MTKVPKDEEEKKETSCQTPGDPEEVEKQSEANIAFFHEY